MRRSFAATLISFALTVSAAGPVSSARAADETTVDRDGWWYRANTANSSPVGSPPVVLPPPPSSVPAGAIAVSAVAGDADKVAAIGLVVGADPGATVERMTLTLEEIDGNGASNRAAEAVIVACPIKSFWAGGEAGDWTTRPEADCALGEVKGERGEGGVWTFDLTPIARAWLDPDATVSQEGVLLQEKADPPATFQVSFAGAASGKIKVDLVATPGEPADDPFGSPGGDGGAAVGGGSTGGFDSGGASSGGGSFDPGTSVGGDGGSSFPLPDATTSDPLPVDGGSGTGTSVEPAAPAGDEQAAPAARNTKILGNLPAVAIFVIPLMLGLGLAMAYALGPAGEPVAHARERGVSRALAARERSGARPRSHPNPALEAS